MRCLSCGFMNTSQAFECARCKNLLDPIAAAATVNVSPDAPSARPVFNPANPSRPPLPDLGPLQQPSAAGAPLSFRFEPQRPNMGSADLDFLLNSDGVARMQKVREVQSSVPTAGTVVCSSCRRELPTEMLFITQGGNDKLLCVDCQAKKAKAEEAIPRRQFFIRIISGTVVGLIAAVACAALSTQFATDLVKHTVNWPMALAVGLIIGLATRFGGLNRPNMVLQIISVLLCIGSLVGCLYFAIDSLTGESLSPTAFFDLKPDPGAYAFLGLSIILAFVVPSGFVGGQRAETFE